MTNPEKKPVKTSSGSVTLEDVAQAAGVSTSTVSRTFTPGASVAQKTRARVLKVATRLGYRPNVIARTLSTRKSRVIGLVVSFLHNQFYPNVIEQLSQSLQVHGYHVLLFISGDPHGTETETDALILDILQYQVAGLVLMSTMMSSNLAIHCRRLGIPVVMFNRIAPVRQVSAVTSDNYGGGRIAARCLIESGARRISFLGGLKDSSTTQDRERGFLDELARQQRSLHSHAFGDYNFELATRATHQLFSTRHVPDAIFVANDYMAIAVLDVLRHQLGLKVPEDVQVIGFDDVPQAAWKAYHLTTIQQDAEQMTRHTVAILLNYLEADSPVPQRLVIPAKLIVRGTTRPRLSPG